MANKKLILFDFDGTIADTFKLSRQVVNDHAEELGFKRLTDKEIEKLRGMTAKEIFTYIKIPLYRLPKLIILYHHEMAKVIIKAFPIKGILNVLKIFKEKGYRLGIVSSSTKENIEVFLNHHNMMVFDFIHSKFDPFGKHGAIKEIIKTYSLNPSRVIYIGDEARDIEAAKKAGVGFIAVTWGFNTKKLLLKHNPTYLVEKPEELISVVSRS